MRCTRTILLRCLDAIAEAHARREVAIFEHDHVLAARNRFYAGVLGIECRVCALVEDQRQQLMRIVSSPLSGGLPGWVQAQRVYSDALGMIKDHRDLLVFDHECLRILIRLMAHVWPEVNSRVDYWRILFLLG